MNKLQLTDCERLAVELIAESLREDPAEAVKSAANSIRKAESMGVSKDLELNPFVTFRAIQTKGCSHFVLDLSKVGRGYVVSSIPTTWKFNDFIINENFATDDEAIDWLKANVAGAESWDHIHVIKFC